MTDQQEQKITRNAQIAAELRNWADKIQTSPFDVHGLALVYYRELEPISVVLSDPTQTAMGFYKYTDERIMDKFSKDNGRGLIGLGN
jgi:hypothetical protein